VSLRSFLKTENIRLGVQADDWQSAIRAAGSILVDNGSVDEEYIQKMIDAAEEYGPYFIVEKGVVLAHAKTESGVHRMGVSFITLKEAVCFGNPEYDPVHLVIALASENSARHLSLMHDLAILMDGPEMALQLSSQKSAAGFIRLAANKLSTYEH